MTLIDLTLSHTAQAYQSGGDCRHCIFAPSPMMNLGRKKLDVWKGYEGKLTRSFGLIIIKFVWGEKSI